MTQSSPAFTPPSPGAWELEQTHFSRPPTVFMADLFPPAMMRGFRESMRAYGALLDYMEIAVINRFIYVAPRPVGAPKSAQGTPPRMLFELLRRLHPEIRRRVRRAEEVFRQRYWREELREWDETVKPQLVAEGNRLLQEDLVNCSDQQLADHVRRASAYTAHAIFNHHRFNAATVVPIGDFLVHAVEWTGATPGELLRLTRGLSPVSAGAVDELSALRSAVRHRGEAVALLRRDRPDSEVLSELLARSDEVGHAARRYLDVVGYRVIGAFDVGERHAREYPELLMKIIRAAISEEDAERRTQAADALARLGERVPAAHREQFEALLAEARLTYRLRDERVFYGDALAVGVMRRAILAAGERLKGRGAVERAEDLVDATTSEIVALLGGSQSPAASELSDRARWRRETPLSAAPATLGFPPSPPPPAEWLPPAAARLQRIITLVLSLMFDARRDPPSAPVPAPPQDEPHPGRPLARTGERRSRQLRGFPVSSGLYEGPARVIRSPDELSAIQAGDVLVTSSTSPTFNVVLPLIGALVTERGGVLSHAAIVSREYGLPGVVGCAGAMTFLKTGMRVRVDGDTGEVWTLS